jgi:hypothetical protein
VLKGRHEDVAPTALNIIKHTQTAAILPYRDKRNASHSCGPPLSLTPMRCAGQARSIMNRGLTAPHYCLIVTTSYLSISCISIPNIPIIKHKGANHFESALANSVFFIFLKNPTYLKSPIALKIKIEGIIQLP